MIKFFTQCKYCKAKFERKKLNQLYCSIVCRKKYIEEKSRKIRICSRCKKEETEFRQQSYCKKCNKIVAMGRRRKERNCVKKRYLTIRKDKKLWKKRLEKNKKYSRKRYKNDSNYNLSMRIRVRIIMALKRYTNTGKIMSSKKYGIDYKKIIEHLKPFPTDISKYHIDHIRPICSFNLIKSDGSPDLEEIKKCFAPENHQWLTIKENLSKGGRWNK